MATKTGILQIEIPISVCFEMIEQSGNDIGWNLIETKPSLYLKWKVGGAFSSKNFSVEATLQQLDVNATKIQVTTSAFGLIDGLGILQQGVNDLINRFNSKAQALFQKMETDMVITKLLGEGLLCPTCGNELDKGTLFCPNDGTKIMKSCPSCNTNNVPNAQFCSSCGIKFIDNG